MLRSIHIENPKVAIGGLGGSGTRVVADIISKAGVYIGSYINSYNDNLIFTRLFKNPSWYQNATDQDISFRLRIFQKIMQGLSLESAERIELKKAYDEKSVVNRSDRRLDRGPRKTLKHWGWKEPNTHIYLEHIAKFFPQLKYVHVMRHGRYMAFSNNTRQLKNWGDIIFNITIPSDEKLNPKVQLDYWIVANQRAITTGLKLLRNRFYVCNYDNLCESPDKEIRALLDFIDLEISSTEIKKLTIIPQKHYSINEHLDNDFSIFSEFQLDCVEKMSQLSGLL